MIVKDSEYIEKNNLKFCYCNKKDCPCCVKYKDKWEETFYCNYPKVFFEMDIENRFQDREFLKQFLLQLCPRKRFRNLSSHLYSDREIVELNKLRQETQIGDTIYSASLMRNVTLIEKIFPDFGIAIVCEGYGFDQKALFRDLKPISQSKQYAEVELDSVKNQDIIKCLILDARELGFRVEKEENNNIVNIKIYCENQDHLNRFINSYGKYNLL